MKNIKTFIIVDTIIFILKVLGGFITHSYTMIASGIYDLVLIMCSLIAVKGNKDNKNLSIITIVIGILSILSVIGLGTFAILHDVKTTSLWVILFLIITLIMRYIVGCFYTNLSYQQRKGLLSYGNIISNIDFYNYAVIIGALILMKVSKWVSVFKYADILGLILIAILVVIKGVKLIKNSTIRLKGIPVKVSEDVLKEIKDRNEVKNLTKLEVDYYGGVRVAKCEVLLKDGIGMVDVNSFVITLQDYLLKIADAVGVFMIDREPNNSRRARARVRSKKADARNSRSRNGKTSPKKKNTRKPNKKR